MPAIRYVHDDGRVQIIKHGTESAARRNVAIVGRGYCSFIWLEEPTLWEQIKRIGLPREADSDMTERVETNGERAERLGVMPAVPCPRCDKPVPIFGDHICGGPITDAFGVRVEAGDSA